MASNAAFNILVKDEFSNAIMDIDANYAFIVRLLIPDGASCGQCAVVTKRTDLGQLVYTV